MFELALNSATNEFNLLTKIQAIGQLEYKENWRILNLNCLHSRLFEHGYLMKKSALLKTTKTTWSSIPSLPLNGLTINFMRRRRPNNWKPFFFSGHL